MCLYFAGSFRYTCNKYLPETEQNVQKITQYILCPIGAKNLLGIGDAKIKDRKKLSLKPLQNPRRETDKSAEGTWGAG